MGEYVVAVHVVVPNGEGMLLVRSQRDEGYCGRHRQFCEIGLEAMLELQRVVVARLVQVGVEVTFVLGPN